MHYQYGRNDLPNPQRPPKRSVLSRFRERFQEKPATAEEVKQLGLNAKREIYKTQIQKAKSNRPSKWGGGGAFSSSGRQPSYRRSSKYSTEGESWALGGGGPGSFLGADKTPSLNFITGQDERPRGRKQESGFGKGLTDLF